MERKRGPLSAAYYSDTSHGVVSLVEDGSFVYTPDAGFTGVDTFTYTDSDKSGLTSIGTVSIDVVDNGPVANPDFYHVGENATLTVDASAGDVAVEDLRIGDQVRTGHAGWQKIKWIGRRSYAAP